MDLWSKFLRTITTNWVYLILIFVGSVLTVMLVIGLSFGILLLIATVTYLFQS